MNGGRHASDGVVMIGGSPGGAGCLAPQPATVAGTARRGVLVVLLLASTLTVMAGTLLAPVVELLRRDLAVSATAAGLVVTGHGLTLALASPLVGRVIDRRGVPMPLTVGLVLYGVAGGAGLVLTSYPALLVSRLLFGVGAAMVFTGTTVALLDHPGTARDQVMGWRSSAISVGGVIWPLLGGALGAISWHAPFAIYLLGVPLALASWLVLPGTHQRKDAPTSSQLTTARSFPPARVTWRDWMTPALLGVYGLQLMAAVLLYGFIVFVPLRLAEVHITATARVAVFAAASSAAMTAVGLIYGRVRTGMGDRPVLTFALGALVLALGVMGLTASSTLMLTAAVVFGVGMGLVVPTLTVQVGEHSPAEVRGQATALLASVTFAGQVLAPLALGPVHAATSVRGAFLTAATLAAVTLTLVATARRSRTAAKR